MDSTMGIGKNTASRSGKSSPILDAHLLYKFDTEANLNLEDLRPIATAAETNQAISQDVVHFEGQ